MRRLVRKWIAREERECCGIVVQKLPNKMERPGIFFRRSHGSEPDLPVNSRLVWRDEWRPPIRITRFSLELVFLPLGISGDDRVRSAFENDFVAFSADASKSAISVHQIQRIEGKVHQLPVRNQIRHRRDAQVADENA